MAKSKKSTSSGPNANSVYVALLRGINVGGKSTLGMAELAAMFTEAGCTDVRTYIQSGNVVFRATPDVAKRIPGFVTQSIAGRFGIRAPVLLRAADAFRQVAAANPFLKSGADVASLHVAFLADAPDRQRVAALDPQRSLGDSFIVRGREIYLHLPNGVARSKLTNAYFDAALATTTTFRNWRTVLKLVEMTQTMG